MPSQIKLITSDNEEFSVDRDVAERSVLLNDMLECEHPITLYNVSATVLAKVISIVI